MGISGNTENQFFSAEIKVFPDKMRNTKFSPEKLSFSDKSLDWSEIPDFSDRNQKLIPQSQITWHDFSGYTGQGFISVGIFVSKPEAYYRKSAYHCAGEGSTILSKFIQMNSTALSVTGNKINVRSPVFVQCHRT